MVDLLSNEYVLEPVPTLVESVPEINNKLKDLRAGHAPWVDPRLNFGWFVQSVSALRPLGWPDRAQLLAFSQRVLHIDYAAENCGEQINSLCAECSVSYREYCLWRNAPDGLQAAFNAQAAAVAACGTSSSRSLPAPASCHGLGR